MKRLILEGFMGCGKSTCGKVLSKEFLIPFADTDKEIEEAEGRSINTIFEESGEEHFRDLETALLLDLSGSDRFPKGVISLGGGMPVREENRALIRSCGTVVYIRASAELLKERLRKRSAGRPMLKDSSIDERVDRLLSEREGIYMEIADHIVETDGKEVYQVVNELKRIYNSSVR